MIKKFNIKNSTSKITHQVFPIFGAASAMTAETYLLLGAPVDLWVVALVGFSTVFGYFFCHGVLLLRLPAWLAGLAAAGIFFQRHYALHPVWLGAVVLGVTYFLPLRWSTRAITWLKPVVIATVWVIYTMVLPLIWSYLSPPTHWAAMLAERFLFIAALALAYDMVDRYHDAQTGLNTVAVRYGRAVTQKLIVALLALAGVAGCFWADPITSVALCLIYAGVAIGLHRPAWYRREPLTVKAWIDWMMVAHFGLLWALG